MGCLSAAGATLGDNLASLFGSVQNVSPLSRFSTDHEFSYPVFEVRQNLEPAVHDPHGPRLSRTCLLLLAAAREALSMAGIGSEVFSEKRVGVCIGTSVGSTMNNYSFYDDFRSDRSPDLEPVHRFLTSNPAACLAREYKVNGPVQTVVNACASGTDAVGTASSWIASGLCDMVLAGGTDELSRFAYNGFASLRILDPAPCRPFDETRNGLNLGEGAGLMILESSDHAKARGSKIMGRVLGYGTACDGHHLISPHPEGRGLKNAIDQALRLSKIGKEDIGFINAHGTGTRDNDRVESLVFSQTLPRVPFFSTKGCTGHTLGAAGAIEAIYTLACLNEQKIPPSAGFTCAQAPVSPVETEMAVSCEIAISQSLAFGGNNVVLVLGRGGE